MTDVRGDKVSDDTEQGEAEKTNSQHVNNENESLPLETTTKEVKPQETYETTGESEAFSEQKSVEVLEQVEIEKVASSEENEHGENVISAHIAKSIEAGEGNEAESEQKENLGETMSREAANKENASPKAMTDVRGDKVSDDTEQGEAEKTNSQQVNKENESLPLETTTKEVKPQETYETTGQSEALSEQKSVEVLEQVEIEKVASSEENEHGENIVSAHIAKSIEAGEDNEAESEQKENLGETMSREAANKENVSQKAVEYSGADKNMTSVDTGPLPEQKYDEKVEIGEVKSNTGDEEGGESVQSTGYKEAKNMASVSPKANIESKEEVDMEPVDGEPLPVKNAEVEKVTSKTSDKEVEKSLSYNKLVNTDASESIQTDGVRESTSTDATNNDEASREIDKDKKTASIEILSGAPAEPSQRLSETSSHEITEQHAGPVTSGVEGDTANVDEVKSTSIVKSDEAISEQSQPESKTEQEVQNTARDTLVDNDKGDSEKTVESTEAADSAEKNVQEDARESQSVSQECLDKGSERKIVSEERVAQNYVAMDDDAGSQQATQARHTPTDSNQVFSNTNNFGPEETNNRQGNSLKSEIRSNLTLDSPEGVTGVLTTTSYLRSVEGSTESLGRSDGHEENVRNYISFIVDSAIAALKVAQEPCLKESKDKFVAPRPMPEESRRSSKQKKSTADQFKLPPLVLHRPCKFEPCSTQNSYLPYPPLTHLPHYPKLAYPKKWGVHLLPTEPKTVLVGFTCPPAPKFRPDQLMTHSASTLRRYYSKPCIKSVEWIKVSGKR